MKRDEFSRRIMALVFCSFALAMGPQTPHRVESDHRDRFKQYKDMPNIRDADPSTLRPVGHPVRIVVGPAQGTLDLSAIGRPMVDYLREYGCAADVVVTATPRAARSEFTTEGTFIFTDYDVDVESVIRGLTVFSGSQIRVLWPGGSLMHNGRSITTTDDSYRLLATERKYLLFLRQIRPGEFETIRETAGYDLTGDQARGLGVGPLRGTQKSHLLVALAHAGVSGCNK